MNSSQGSGEHLILYDGVCGLCDRMNQFVLAHDPGGVFVFAPLQSPTARAILQRFDRTPDDLDTFYVVKDYRSDSAALLWKAQGTLFVLDALGGVWRAAALLRVLPTSLLDKGYDLVAGNRYRWFGRFERCRIPTAGERGRFIDPDPS